MRRTSLTSALLILFQATSSSACVAGWGSQPATSCHRPGTQQGRALKRLGTVASIGLACGPLLKSPPGRCGVRNFVHFQFVAFHTLEVPIPLQQTARSLPALSDSMIIVSPIGSPETDRGPPAS